MQLFMNSASTRDKPLWLLDKMNKSKTEKYSVGGVNESINNKRDYA